jgi:hypothetical protein
MLEIQDYREILNYFFSCFAFQEFNFFFVRKTQIYLQYVIIHSANGGNGEGWHVEEYSVSLLC